MEKRFLRHLLFWLAYLTFEIYTEFEWMSNVFKQYSNLEVFKMAFYPEIMLLFFVKIPLVYFSFYFFKNINKKLNLVFALTILLFSFSFVGFLMYKYFFLSNIYNNLETFQSSNYQLFINSFMDKIFIVGVTIALKSYSISQKLIQREQTLIKEKVEAELNFLKSQINPHFLFNTLNNIYSLARKKSDKTPDIVLKLSKLLRFVLYETQNKKITIEREIQFLNDYIDLEKIRYDSRLDLKINIKVDDFNLEIAPLLLIPMVENAFKHGASETTSNTFLNIDFIVNNGKLEFSVANSFDKKQLLDSTNIGIGLKNLKRQLEIIYPNYDLITNNENSIFKSILKIDLN